MHSPTTTHANVINSISVRLSPTYFVVCNALTTNYMFQWQEDVLFMKRTQVISGTKHRLVCTHFDAFTKLGPNMGIQFNSSEIFEKTI